MSLSAPERETVVNGSDGDPLVTIETFQRRYITKLKRNQAFTLVAEGEHDGSVWARFTIPADQWNPASGAKRKSRPMTDEERQAAADRLRKAREASK